MESIKIQEIITETLKQYGFSKEPEFRSKSWEYWMLFYVLQPDKEYEEFQKSEVEVLKLMKVLREIRQGKEGIKVSRTMFSGTLTIMDAEVIESMASGLDELYRKKFAGLLMKEKEFIDMYFKNSPSPLEFIDWYFKNSTSLNLNIDFINKRLYFLESCVLADIGLPKRSNQKIGIFAGLLVEALEDEGIFKGEGEGIVKEYACIYDIFIKIGFQMVQNVCLPDTNSTKYDYIREAIRAARKKLDAISN